jgi:hypothetical protein
MRGRVDEEERIPKEWSEEFHERGDLERAFYILRESRGYYADGLRGWIRSLQLRTDAAWRYLRRSHERSGEIPLSLLGAARSFGVILFSVETALLDGDMNLAEAPKEEPLPDRFDEVLAAYPEARAAMRVQKVLEGIRRLRVGEHDKAAEVFEDLVEEDREVFLDDLPQDHLLLSASRLNGGNDATKELQDAQRTTEECPCMIARARAAANLAGILSYLGQANNAERWRGFLRGLGCPEATRSVFLKRADVVLNRSRIEKRVVVL